MNSSNLIATANTLRVLAMDGVQKANSGHPGMPMGMADAASVLWANYLKFDPKNPEWADRDRFVLSAGHGSMLLYGLLHLSGYDLSLEDLKNFRQWGSKTPGHPEYGHTAGVETTTGPLGSGISTAVGMAFAERWSAAKFNRPDFSIINHRTYVIAGDGDLMEGVSSEASSLAGHWGLGRLIVLYDDNQICIEGATDKSFTEDVLARYAAYGWQTARVDGHDTAAVAAALDTAIADEERPSLIACRTTIGFGSPNLAGSEKTHGSPLGADEIRLTKEALGVPLTPFWTDPVAYETLGEAGRKGAKGRESWEKLLAGYAKFHPELAARFMQMMSGLLPNGWDDLPLTFDKPLATRASSGKILNALSANLPALLGGSADLAGSNKTAIEGAASVQKGEFDGRNIHFGVREHGMASIMNGMALHGIIPYGGTFLVFADYMRGAMRLAALMGLGTIYVLTHDSIGLGEDGPTHQPIETLASLRAMPNLNVMRPADAWETAVAWKVAIENRQTPTVLALTRQGLAPLDKEKAEGVRKGAYVLSDAADLHVILMGSGSEVHIALEAQALLAQKGIAARVVSMPCWELFEAQPQAYKDEVLPPAVTARVSMEAAVTQGWEKYTGSFGAALGINHFGASAPFETLYEEFGLTAVAMADAAEQLVTGRVK